MIQLWPTCGLVVKFESQLQQDCGVLRKHQNATVHLEVVRNTGPNLHTCSVLPLQKPVNRYLVKSVNRDIVEG